MKKEFALTLYAAVLFAVYSVVIGYLLMMLWNWLIPDIFGLSEITFSQSIGFLFFYYLIFNYNLRIKKLISTKSKTQRKNK